MPTPEKKESAHQFARDVRKGLGSTPKYLLSKYFYDKVGSELFEEITSQPEYYPTRTEAAILRDSAADIRDEMEGDISLVELGSGSSAKTTILLESILEEQNQLHYLPIDISDKMLAETTERLNSRYSDVVSYPIASEYDSGLGRANGILMNKPETPERKLVLFLGSSIGNFEPSERASFLQTVQEKMTKTDGFLVGFDLQKDEKILNAAYNDRAGVTARFNRNILSRINKELGGEFVPEQRVEMHLVSTVDQEVAIRGLGESYHFREEETIHTENSYKFTPELIETEAQQSSFEVKKIFTDEKDCFALVLLGPI